MGLHRPVELAAQTGQVKLARNHLSGNPQDLAPLLLALIFLAPNDVYFATHIGLGRRGAKMPDEEWVKILYDSRRVKFTYQQLPDDRAFITAQIEGNEVVYSVVLTEARNPLTRENVESHFKDELSKK
jgi:hypothetical protein